MALMMMTVFFLSHESVVPYLADKYLKGYGFSYAKIQGSLFEGITIEEGAYKKSVAFKTLTLKYDFLGLLRLSPTFDVLRIDALHVNINTLPKASTKDEGSSFIFGFKFRELQLQNAQVLHENNHIMFDLDTKDVAYDNDLHVGTLVLEHGIIKDANRTMRFDIKGSTLKYLQEKEKLSIEKIAIHKASVVEEKRTFAFDLTGTKVMYAIPQRRLHASKMTLDNGLMQEENRTIALDFSGVNIDYDQIQTKLHVKQLAINKGFIKEVDENVAFELESTDLIYDKTLDAKMMNLDIISSFGRATLRGILAKSRLIADARVDVDTKIEKEYLSFLTKLPKMYALKLDAGLDEVRVSTRLDSFGLSGDENVSIQDVDLHLVYDVNEKNATVATHYNVAYQAMKAKVNQRVLLGSALDFHSSIQATLTHPSIPLPFKTVDMTLAGNKHNIRADINSSNLNISVEGKEYKHFDIQTRMDELPLSFFEDIPSVLKQDVLSLAADLKLSLNPFSLSGVLDMEDANLMTRGSLSINDESTTYQALIDPKKNSDLFKDISLEKLSPFTLVLYHSKETQLLNVDAKLVNISLFKNADALNGWGNIGASSFDVLGSLKKNAQSLSLNANLLSIKTLVSDLGMTQFDTLLFYDAEAKIGAKFTIGDTIETKVRIDIPWYVFQTDTQTAYNGIDSFVQIQSFDGNITVDAYNVDVMNHRLYSKKNSKVVVNKEAGITLQELWVYDNLLLTGFLDPLKKEGDIHIQSERFTYSGEEGNITARADIKASFKEDGSQNVEGSITLIDGVITYVPRNDYSIRDDDIIIIQEIKEFDQIKRTLNIRIDSLSPIRYKVKNVDIMVRPDVTLYQEKKMPLELLGLLRLDKGKVSGAGKEFELDKSEIYFYGKDILNPYININVHHYTLDDIDIEIFITNTLDSPVIIFSSTPSMSQDDIMSYILFGQPASSLFEKEGGDNKTQINTFLLGTGLKKIVNETSAIKIDTLNILNNKEGTFGYEIGSRISKELRVVYKNDTISSVIVQYSMNRSTRVDVDVKETGQGVKLLYIKDF